jgi:hypothetical protein
LIGIYRRNGGNYLYGYAYGGRLGPDSRKKIVTFCTLETDAGKAQAKAEEFMAKLNQ